MGFVEDVRAVIKQAIDEYPSLNQLAKKSGVLQSNLHRWQKDFRDPRLSSIAPLMDFLDMTVCKRGSEPLTPPPLGSKDAGLYSSIMEGKMKDKIARLEAQNELLRQMVGAPPAPKAEEKNAAG